MKKLLLPVDGSDSALRAVQYVAREAAQYAQPPAIELVHVLEPLTAAALADQLSLETIYPGDGLPERTPPMARDAIEPARQVLDGAGLEYQVQLRIGDPVNEIVTHAHTAGVDQIVMGTRGRGGFASLMLGSVASQVVQAARVPVTLVK